MWLLVFSVAIEVDAAVAVAVVVAVHVAGLAAVADDIVVEPIAPAIDVVAAASLQ